MHACKTCRHVEYHNRGEFHVDMLIRILELYTEHALTSVIGLAEGSGSPARNGLRSCSSMHGIASMFVRADNLDEWGVLPDNLGEWGVLPAPRCTRDRGAEHADSHMQSVSAAFIAKAEGAMQIMYLVTAVHACQQIRTGALRNSVEVALWQYIIFIKNHQNSCYSTAYLHSGC